MTIYEDILNTVIDNGRIFSAHSQEDFEAQLKNEIEFEAAERKLGEEETELAVQFAFDQASF